MFTFAGCATSEPYQPKTLTPVIDAPIIAESGTLRVGVEGDSAPFTLTSSEGEMVGLDVEMAAAISKELGLKLSLVDVQGDPEGALQNGEVDVVMGMTSADASKSMWVSEPYTQTAIALFAASADQSVPTRDESPSIAAQTSSTSAWAVQQAFGDEALVPNKDLMSALSSLETNSANFVAADAVIGTYAALRENVSVVPIALLENPNGYAVATLASNDELQQALTNALSAVTGGGIASVINSKWLGETADLLALPVVEVSATEAPVEDLSDSENGESASGDHAEDNGEVAPDADEDANFDEATDGSTAGSNAVIQGTAA